MVNPDLDLGRRIVGALDAAGFPVRAAFWHHIPEVDDWRLVIATEAAEHGTLDGYGRLQEVLNALPPPRPSLEDVVLTRATDPIVKLLSRAIHVGDGGYGGVWFTGNVIDGVPIDDLYIYRVA